MSASERFELLTRCGPGTEMGTLLRRFWHPVATAQSVKPGSARRIRILGEDLTLYRGQSGAPYLVAGNCPHRRTQLDTGWVQGEEIRCIYHGWRFDGAGRCTEAPAEGIETASKIRITHYPVREYAGLLFSYLGVGDPPAELFDLQRKPSYEAGDVLILAREQTWPMNWFQQVENSLDAVHVSFVHRAGKIGPFGEAVTSSIPALEYLETEAGIRQVATRAAGNVRVSDWTFPNYNHIVTPGMTKDGPWVHRGVWNVPVDDFSTLKFGAYAIPSQGDAANKLVYAHFEQYGDYNPAEHHDALYKGEWPTDPFLQLTAAQDYVAISGQGRVVDRTKERLGKSDAGIVLLRRIFWRELEALRAGGNPKVWRKLASDPELPVQRAGSNTHKQHARSEG